MTNPDFKRQPISMHIQKILPEREHKDSLISALICSINQGVAKEWWIESARIVESTSKITN
jgi:hypothetical protein